MHICAHSYPIWLKNKLILWRLLKNFYVPKFGSIFVIVFRVLWELKKFIDREEEVEVIPSVNKMKFYVEGIIFLTLTSMFFSFLDCEQVISCI